MRLRGIQSASVVLLYAFVPAVALAQQQDEKQPAAPKLELSPTDFSFGEVWQGEDLKREFTIKNVGDAPLEIRDVKSSCGCTVPTRPTSPVAPGESTKFTISYDAQKRVGPASQTVTLLTNDPVQGTISIQITGSVKPVYELDPKDGLVFGQLYESSAETRKLVIVNRYPEKMVLKLKEGQKFDPFKVELTEVEAGMKYMLTASTQPPLSVGRFTNPVMLQTSNPRAPEILVNLYGFVQPPVAVRPSKLILPRGSTAEIKRVLRISHAPGHDLEITKVQASHPAIRVELSPQQKVAPGTGASLTEFELWVYLPPGSEIPEGEKPQIEITTTSQDPKYQHLVVPVQLLSAGGPIQVPATQPTTSPAAGKA